MTKCTIHLVRHGQTDANAHQPPILQGKGADYSLNDVGRQQASAAGQGLSTRPVRAVYASPLLRAQQTAEAVAAAHGLAIQTIERLHEVDVGEWEGLSWDDVVARHPKTYAKVISYGGDRPYPSGESYVDVADRALPELLAIAERHPGEEVAVVAHRVVNRCVIARLIGLDVRRSKDLPQDNGAINVLQGDGTRLKVVTLNAVSHLLSTDR